MKNFVFFSIFLIFFCCTNTKVYRVKGTLIEIRKNKHQFIIHHDEIPGFMMAMTMPFTLADTTDLNRFHIGDSLQFELIINNKKSLAKNFQLVGKGTLLKENNIWDDEFSHIEVGEIITDVTLLNSDSIEVALSDSDGKFRLISYIFSRCPMPTMCPEVIIKNQFLAQTFKKNPHIEFILVSFDYIYDTPSTLDKTYSSLIENNYNIKFYSSVHHLNDIFRLAGESNVSFWGVDENDIGHSLRSILLDPERRLMKAYDGMDWEHEKVKLEISNILNAYSF